VKIFLDSANYKEIEKWNQQGVIDGVTTNPSIMFKDGVYDLEEGARRICAMLGERPVSVEVTTNDHGEMIRQARQFASWAPNVVVKIPVVNEHGESCLGVVNELFRQGIRVNTTAILSFNQAMLAAKAGATYISIFAGRVADEGHDPAAVIGNVRRWLEDWGSPAEIIVGSIRTVMDIQNAALAGAHIITIPPQFLPKMVDHKYTRETVRQFNRDAEKALMQIAEVREGTNGDNCA
jgi:transaldolase